jgi:hypothetical protein
LAARFFLIEVNDNDETSAVGGIQSQKTDKQK